MASLHPDTNRPAAAVVIGLGLMGCDIAAIFLAGGYKVTDVEPNAVHWSRQRERVEHSVRQIGDGSDAGSKLGVVSQIAEVNWSDVALVVVCAPENLSLK